jgi:pimeloyl-ACP methyl ester carboxylesterase
MAKCFVSQLFIALFLLSRLTHAAQLPISHTWKMADMKPEGIGETPTGSTKAVEILPAKATCGLPRCKFELYYFKGDNFNLNDSARKNILYIPGGPGQIVDREKRSLALLEANHNVFYFDLRGSGLSTIDGDNRYDKFLRGDYVISDIEEIRLKELGPSKPWDAIFAHSAGTVIAQKYAARYGASKVTRLILSAPVSKQRDTEPARISMIASNIDSIYRIYRTNRDDRSCPIRIRDVGVAIGFLEPPDDLCFVQPEQRAAINKRLVELLTEFNKVYGSVGFVIQNLEKLKDEKEFRDKYRYPEAFFKALRVLEYSGAPGEGLTYDEETKKKQINAALLIGYYLSFDKASLPADRDSACKTEAPFWAGLRRAFFHIWESKYCKRLEKAKASPRESPNESVRANEVFGVYDGVSRSVFGMLKQQQLVDKKTNCFTGKDLISFATNEIANTSKVAREAARKIGVEPDKQFCPWNPTTPEHKHSVPTLILRGGADAVTNGCQAEDIFNDALTGQRVLIEFRGAGHFMRLPIAENDASDGGSGQLFTTVLNIVLETPPTDFAKIVNNPTIKGIKERKRGEVHSSDEMGANRLSCNMG